MGYDIHITRAEDWGAVRPDQEITAHEWLAYVNQDPELRLKGKQYGAHFAIWTGQSARRPDSWFDWAGGEIYTKGPDATVIAKAIGIARAFGARVQGDDGEIYLPDGRIEQDGVIQTGPGMDWTKF